MENYFQRIKSLPLHQQQVLNEKLRDWLAVEQGGAQNAASLAVFYVSRSDMSAAAVQAFLGARLPNYILPAEYVRVDALPKTIHGKIDRVGLMKLRGDERKTVQRAPVVLSDETEKKMAGIWTRILNVPEIGAGDNFFELGGHSLLATQVIMEIEEVFGVNIPLNTLFKFPTIAQLCRHMETAKPARAVKDSAPKVLREEAVPLSNAQRRLWYISQLSERGLEYKIVKVLEMRGRLNMAALQQGIAEIVGRHESLRTCFGYKSGKLVQIVLPRESVAMGLADLSALTTESKESGYRRIEEEILLRPFDLERGPLMRLILVRYSESHARLIFDVHHIIVDGWSFGILVRELNSLFRSFSGGLPGELEPLPAQYRDYTIWERESLGQADIDRQLAYWRGQLSNVPDLDFGSLALTPSPGGEDGELNFEFDRDLSRRIAETCARMQGTPFSFLTSVYFALLYMYTGSLDTAIGTDVANRDLRRYSDLIGFFSNQLVLRITARENLTFGQLWQITRQRIEEAFEHKDVPYDTMVRAVTARSKKRDRDSLFRAKFVLHHDIPDISISGIETSFIDAGSRTTKFDLLLNVEEGRDGLRGKLEYRGTLFDEAGIRRMVGDFLDLCDHATRDIETTLKMLCRKPEAGNPDTRRDLAELNADRQKGLREFLTARKA